MHTKGRLLVRPKNICTCLEKNLHFVTPSLTLNKGKRSTPIASKCKNLHFSFQYTYVLLRPISKCTLPHKYSPGVKCKEFGCWWNRLPVVKGGRTSRLKCDGRSQKISKAEPATKEMMSAAVGKKTFCHLHYILRMIWWWMITDTRSTSCWAHPNNISSPKARMVADRPGIKFQTFKVNLNKISSGSAALNHACVLIVLGIVTFALQKGALGPKILWSFLWIQIFSASKFLNGQQVGRCVRWQFLFQGICSSRVEFWVFFLSDIQEHKLHCVWWPMKKKRLNSQSSLLHWLRSNSSEYSRFIKPACPYPWSLGGGGFSNTCPSLVRED